MKRKDSITTSINDNFKLIWPILMMKSFTNDNPEIICWKLQLIHIHSNDKLNWNGFQRKETSRDWSDENYNDNVWNSITRGYGIYTEGGSGVKVKLTLNTLSVMAHERLWVHETFLEELWRKEYEQSCVKTIVFIHVWSHCITYQGRKFEIILQKSLKQNGLRKCQDSNQHEAIPSQERQSIARWIKFITARAIKHGKECNK